MYEPQLILDAIDGDTVPILLGFTGAMVLQNVAMITAVAMTRREGWISIPLPCTSLWFAHDLGVVVRFDTWYNQHDHWFLKLFWVGLLTALIIEFVFLWQAYKVGPQGVPSERPASTVGGVARRRTRDGGSVLGVPEDRLR